MLIAVSLFFFDWRMAVASLWVLPVAYAIVGLSAKVQQKLSDKSMDAKMACADGIQAVSYTHLDVYKRQLLQRKSLGIQKEYTK